MAVPRTSTKNKRTPRGTVDDAQRAEDDEWEVDKISARRQKGQVVQYLVHWKGCEDFNATWEPASHLAGAAETVAKYEKEWAKEQKQAKAEALAKHKERVEIKKQVDAETAARVALALETMKTSPPQVRKNASPWWKYYARQGAVKGTPEYHTAVCIVPDPANNGKPDGKAVDISRSSNGMEDYIKSRYRTLWLETDKEVRPHKYQDPVTLEAVTPPGGQPFKTMADVHKQDCDAELVAWFQESDRKREMCTDAGFARFVKKVQAFPGNYKLPYKTELNRAYARRGGKGRQHAKDWINEVKSQGRKVSIAGDIWADGDLSLLVILGYAILKRETKHGALFNDMRLEEEVLAVVPFSRVRHTGDEILAATRRELNEVGITDLYSEIFRKCSDAGSNIKKGWNGFEGGNQTCVDHKCEREVIKYYTEPDVGNVAADRNKLAGHLAHSLPSQRALQDSQKLFSLPSRKAVQSCTTRWRSEHDQSRWYRQNEAALQDARFMVDGAPGYSEHMLTREQFVLNNEEEASLNPIARMELALEPGTSVTISLVLPLVDACMYALSEGTGVTVDGTFRPYDELHEATKRARSRVHDGLTHAFSTGNCPPPWVSPDVPQNAIELLGLNLLALWIRV